MGTFRWGATRVAARSLCLSGKTETNRRGAGKHKGRCGFPASAASTGGNPGAAGHGSLVRLPEPVSVEGRKANPLGRGRFPEGTCPSIQQRRRRFRPAPRAPRVDWRGGVGRAVALPTPGRGYYCVSASAVYWSYT
jgi:hypothetical protein